MNETIYELGNSLNIGSIMEDQRGDLEEYAKRNEWGKIATQLDDVHHNMKEAISNAGESDLVILASVGGWLEGLNIVSGHIQNSYSKNKSTLLNQGSLIDFYRDQLKDYPNKNSIVKEVEAKLGEVSTILSSANEKDGLPESDIKKLHSISSALIAKIENS